MSRAIVCNAERLFSGRPESTPVPAPAAIRSASAPRTHAAARAIVCASPQRIFLLHECSFLPAGRNAAPRATVVFRRKKGDRGTIHVPAAPGPSMATRKGNRLATRTAIVSSVAQTAGIAYQKKQNDNDCRHAGMRRRGVRADRALSPARTGSTPPRAPLRGAIPFRGATAPGSRGRAACLPAHRMAHSRQQARRRRRNPARPGRAQHRRMDKPDAGEALGNVMRVRLLARAARCAMPSQPDGE